jgi:hydroxymethylpyrimidine/phosphomethylpyrimidine kinase
MFYVTALTIAGSDCSGGAGIQADMKTFSALGVYSASVITAVTVQNTHGVQQVCSINADIVASQIKCVISDIRPVAIKIGMVDNHETMIAIADTLSSYPCQYIVVDPVMLSSSGVPLMHPDDKNIFCERLIPMATLLTPNLPEAESLAEMKIHDVFDIRTAAYRIAKYGCHNILIKGGHVEGDTKSDYLFRFRDGVLESESVFEDIAVDTRNTHGTGCTLSSAITAFLARGMEMADAVLAAKTFVVNALRYGADIKIGEGHGPLNHFFAPEPMIIRK